MKYDYHADTDSLYIRISPQPGVNSEEVYNGVVFDYNAEGKVVGIDIEHASQKFDIREIAEGAFSSIVSPDSKTSSAKSH